MRCRRRRSSGGFPPSPRLRRTGRRASTRISVRYSPHRRPRRGFSASRAPACCRAPPRSPRSLPTPGSPWSASPNTRPRTHAGCSSARKTVFTSTRRLTGCRTHIASTPLPFAGSNDLEPLELMEPMEPKNMRFATRAIHSCQPSDAATGALIAPIYQTSTFEQESPGVNLGFDYSRTNNPTRQRLEEVLADLEGVSHCAVFASGLAAEHAVLHAYLRPHDEIIVPQDVYGGT